MVFLMYFIRIIVFILFILFQNFVFAKDLKDEIKIEVKKNNREPFLFCVGVNRSSLKIIDSGSPPLISNDKALAGLNIGFLKEINIFQHIYIRLGLSYEERRFSHLAKPDYQIALNIEEVASETSLHYMTIPLGGTLRLPIERANIDVYLNGGVYGSMLIYAEGTHKELGDNISALSPFTFHDYGWNVRTGLFYDLAKKWPVLGFELAYSHGLHNIADGSVNFGQGPRPYRNYQNRTFSGVATIGF